MSYQYNSVAYHIKSCAMEGVIKAGEGCSLQQLGDPTVDSAELFANAGKQMKNNFKEGQGEILTKNFKVTSTYEPLIFTTGMNLKLAASKLPKIVIARNFALDSSSEPLTDSTMQSSNDGIDCESSSDDEDEEIDFDNLTPEYDLSRGNYKVAGQTTLKIAS